MKFCYGSRCSQIIRATRSALKACSEPNYSMTRSRNYCTAFSSLNILIIKNLATVVDDQNAELLSAIALLVSLCLPFSACLWIFGDELQNKKTVKGGLASANAQSRKIVLNQACIFIVYSYWLLFLGPAFPSISRNLSGSCWRADCA